MKKYPYAVLDANQAEDVAFGPYSCHLTREAALTAASLLNREANSHYRAVQWDDTIRARAFWPDCLLA